MNIVIDAREAQLQRVGVSVYANNIVPRLLALAHHNHRVTLIASGSSSLPFETASNVSVLKVAPSPNAKLSEKLRWYYNLPTLLKTLEADVFFGSITKVPFMPELSCPVVITAHDAASISSENLVGGGLARFLTMRFFGGSVNTASKIICISHHCLEEFSEIFGDSFRKKASVIYHGVPDEFKEAVDKLDLGGSALDELGRLDLLGKRYILTVGTITPKKNLIRLMDAFDELDSEGTLLVIAGQAGFGAENVFRHKLSLNRSDQVHFIGAIPTPTLAILMKYSEFFVFPSLYEGFGIPVLEAFYAGVPVLCSNATCLPEIAGDAAILFDPLNVDELTAKMNCLLSSQYETSLLIERGRERAEKFNWEKSASAHLHIIEAAALEFKEKTL